MKEWWHLIATKFSLQFVLIVAFFFFLDDGNSIPGRGQLKVFHVTRKEIYILHLTHSKVVWEIIESEKEVPLVLKNKWKISSPPPSKLISLKDYGAKLWYCKWLFLPSSDMNWLEFIIIYLIFFSIRKTVAAQN